MSFSYNKVAYIHQLNDTAWFNLTVKFPFHYDKDTAVYTNETVSPDFRYEQEIEICSWLFLGVNVVWFIMAVAIVMTYFLVHGGERMEKAATMVSFDLQSWTKLVGTDECALKEAFPGYKLLPSTANAPLPPLQCWLLEDNILVNSSTV